MLHGTTRLRRVGTSRATLPRQAAQVMDYAKKRHRSAVRPSPEVFLRRPRVKVRAVSRNAALCTVRRTPPARSGDGALLYSLLPTRRPPNLKKAAATSSDQAALERVLTGHPQVP